MIMFVENEGLPEQARGECSLCVLTNQFLKYMASTGENAVDLKQAANELQVLTVTSMSIFGGCGISLLPLISNEHSCNIMYRT
jgi:hypothetical protein